MGRGILTGIFLITLSVTAKADTLAFGRYVDHQKLQIAYKTPVESMPLLFQAEGIAYQKLETDSLAMASKNQKTFDGNTLGVFLSPDVASDGVSRPTIMVREGSDKWTHVHEYVHFLLSLEKRDVGTQSDLKDAQEDYLESFAKFKEAGMKFPNQKLKETILSQLLDVSKKVRSLMLNYPLEEMAIENHLQKAYLSGELMGASPQAFLDSNKYISRCHQSATNQMNWVLGHIQLVLEALQFQEQGELQTEKNVLTSLIAEANSVSRIQLTAF